MRRAALILTLAIMGTAALADDVQAANYVIMVQGRGWSTWNGEMPSAAGWTNVTLSFNGNAKLNGGETNVTVRNAILNHCSSGHSCIIHCYSAGCLRVLKAVTDLRSAGNTLPGLLWAEASASAAGGTKLAEVATKGFTGFLAKLLGQQEKIDFDLTPAAARSTWGYVQGNFGATMYHIAGKNNVCKKILFVKICGNKYVDAGVGDGVVGMDSASGASSPGKFYDGCAVAKYPYRVYDSWFSPCGGEARDHFGMPGRGAAIIGSCLSGSSNDANRNWSDSSASTAAECNDAAGECDGYFENSGQNFSMTPSLVQVAGSVATTSSPTTGTTSGPTCAGKCGKFSGAGCWCDAACVYFGDCCSDYYAQRCDIINAP